MDAKMQAWRKRMPSKRQLTSTLGQLVQQKSVAVLYTPTEQERIKQMTEMIAQATSDYEADEDWDRILRVVDALSSVSNHAVLKESIRYLRLRLGDPSSHVVILALTLTESLVKNCGDLVHLEIATEAFMNEMESLYRTHANKRGRESMEIAGRVLDMVQAWGEAFLPYRHEFPLFVDTYHNMRKKGVKFPEQYDESKVPVLTSPPAGASAGRVAARGGRASNSRPAASYHAQGTGQIDTSSFSSSSSGLGGLSTLELYRVAMNVSEMFEDMLFEAQKDSSAIGNHGVIEELATQAREIVHRMEGAIPIAVAEGDEDLEKYLSVNDDLHGALAKYDALQASNQEDEHNGGKVAHNSGGAEDIDLIDPFGLKEEAVSQGNQGSSDDDPFSDFVRARAGSQTKSAGRGSIVNEAASPKTEHADVKAPPTSTPQQDDEEDDPFASFVQHRATKILGSSNQDAEKELKLKPAVPEPAKDLIDLWDDPAPVETTVPAQSTTKPDLWLDDDFLSSPGQPNVVLSSASSKSPVDDLWAGGSTSQSSVPVAASLGTASSSMSTSASDPFDIMGFSKKTSISSPAPTNPFDVLQPTESPHPQQQQPTTKSSNPFDF